MQCPEGLCPDKETICCFQCCKFDQCEHGKCEALDWYNEGRCQS